MLTSLLSQHKICKVPRMELYLIRHCQSENNALWQRTGSANGRKQDPVLTDLGHLQGQQLGKFLAQPYLQKPDSPQAKINNHNGYCFTHLYCSLMRRSIQTATYIAEALNMPLVALDNAHERGGIYLHNPETGVNEGLPGFNRAYFEAEYPHLILPDSLGEEGWWERPYEDRDTARQRAVNFLEGLLATHGQNDDKVAVVIHGGFYQSILHALSGATDSTSNLSAERRLWFKYNNGAISRIDFFDDHVVVAYQNRIDFMPTELLS